MKDQIILIGGGGHCKSVIDCIESQNSYKIAGILDLEQNIGKEVLGYKVVGTDSQIESFHNKGYSFLITLGHMGDVNLREKTINRLNELGAFSPTIISKTAHVSKHTSIGPGTVIHHNACINADVLIGNHNIINSSSLIEHDVSIGDNNHISTMATLNGSVKLDNSSFLGSNSTIIQNIKICSKVIVGASSLVTNDIMSPGKYYGSPAKKIK